MVLMEAPRGSTATTTHILRLEIAVNKVVFVAVLERKCNLRDIDLAPRLRELPFGNLIIQVAARDKLEAEVDVQRILERVVPVRGDGSRVMVVVVAMAFVGGGGVGGDIPTYS